MADRIFSSQADIITATTEDILGVSASDILGIGNGAILGVEDTSVSTDSYFYVERYFSSTSAIQFATDNENFLVEREFNSTATIQTTLNDETFIRSNVFVSQSDIVSATNSVALNRSNVFASQADIVVSVPDMQPTVIGMFWSTTDIQTTTPTSQFNTERYFNSQCDIISDAVGDINLQNLFVSHADIVTNVDEQLFKYKISGYKKLEYLTTPLVPEHISHFYPNFKKLVRVFLRFLDYYPMFRTIAILKNNDLNKIFPEFVDFYLDQYFNDVIDITKYGLSENNKKLYLLLSRLLNNSKGTQKAFNYLFRTLTNIVIANEDVNISVDKIITDFIEDESLLLGDPVLFYDGTYDYDGTIDHSFNPSRPYTYQFKINQSRETMLPLIRAVHPAGFQQEFLIDMILEDEVSHIEEMITTTTYYHYYAYGEADMTWYSYDGSIDYSGSRQIISAG